MKKVFAFVKRQKPPRLPKRISDDTYINLYKEYNNYVNRELTVINNRLTWGLTIHGFLYATYGFTLQKLFDHANDISGAKFHVFCNLYNYELTQLYVFLSVITFVGILISWSGLLSINAATQAMKALAEIFKIATGQHAHENLSITDDENRKFNVVVYRTKTGIIMPSILGGGNKKLDFRGNGASKYIPVVLMTGWLLSGTLLFSTMLSNLDSFCNPFKGFLSHILVLVKYVF